MWTDGSLGPIYSFSSKHPQTFILDISSASSTVHWNPYLPLFWSISWFEEAQILDAFLDPMGVFAPSENIAILFSNSINNLTQNSRLEIIFSRTLRNYFSVCQLPVRLFKSQLLFTLLTPFCVDCFFLFVFWHVFPSCCILLNNVKMTWIGKDIFI